jgi:hypothetical protein
MALDCFLSSSRRSSKFNNSESLKESFPIDEVTSKDEVESLDGNEVEFRSYFSRALCQAACISQSSIGAGPNNSLSFDEVESKRCVKSSELGRLGLQSLNGLSKSV